MNVLQPNATFRLLNKTFVVDCLNGKMARFHKESDVYDVWEWPMGMLESARVDGALTIVESTYE